MANAQSSSSDPPNARIAPVGYFDDQVFVYKFLPADGSIATLAQRFNVDETALWKLNGQSSSWRPAAGEVLRIPRPPELGFGDCMPPGSSYQQHNVEETITLTALLQRLSSSGHLAQFDDGGPPGSGDVGKGETLAIWHYWRNAKLREDVLSRSPDAAGDSDSEWASLSLALPGLDIVEGKGGGAATLNADNVIFLPLTPMAEHEMAVAPNATATADLTPTPLELARRRLSGVHGLLQLLIGLRTEAQRIQAECTACLRVLRQLHALIEAEQNQYDSTASIALHGDNGDDGRAELKGALEKLLAEASTPLLQSPQPTVTPSFPGRWKRTMSQLLLELKSVDLRRLLDQVIPQYGEVVCVIDGVKDRQNFVETVCAIAAQAAYWVAETGGADSNALLDDAMAIMGSGAKPTASTTSSLLDYAAALAGAGPTLSPSCTSDSSYAYCGVVTNLFISGGLATSSIDPSLCATKVRSAVSTLLGADIDEYLGATVSEASHSPASPEASRSGGSTVATLQSSVSHSLGTISGAKEKKEYDDEDLETAASFRAPDPEDDIVKTKRLVSFYHRPEKLLGRLAGPIGNIRTLWGVLKSVIETGSDVNEFVEATSDLDRLKKGLEAGKAGVETAAKALEAVQKLGIVEEAAIERTVAIFGRVTMVFSVLLEVVEGVEALAASETEEGILHLVGAAGLALLVAAPVAPVFLFIGGAALIAGNAIASCPEFFTLETGAARFFHKSFDRFKGTASKFDGLRPYIKSVEDSLTAKTLPVLEPMQFMAQQAVFAGTGLTSQDLSD